ncbi:putative intracellular septation protein A [Polymorphobacter multimanifer]|uniref:Inner membrane-spanning protein YciB n=1 Tax=Polymorphobacter multimanifer TaxID=1070431 RepID=A0A841LDN4_9SPHN|nr:septation protein IspZ [Polymorphobacter multimanifer]MBB6227262.1 intracellular septation protein [Polymorphobacter multimanifer]GGI76568.1 putative intracellular septation protein A [Polymorphobacter multimanifer]
MQKMSGPLKFAVDLGPLLVFFIANKIGGLFVATAAVMVATAIAMAFSWFRERHISVMTIVSAVIITVFGALTLWLKDETFIKMKPTLIYGLFAVVLLGGLARGRSYLQLVLGSAVPDLPEAMWRKLTLNWGLFFVGMMGVNEVARRVLVTDDWVSLKVWGLPIATILFALSQARLLTPKAEKAPTPPEH